jgi:hypothetical protein
MHFTSIFTVALAALASAQSPVGYVPSVSQSLNVRYGNQTVKANQTLTQAGMCRNILTSLDPQSAKGRNNPSASNLD